MNIVYSIYWINSELLNHRILIQSFEISTMLTDTMFYKFGGVFLELKSFVRF